MTDGGRGAPMEVEESQWRQRQRSVGCEGEHKGGERKEKEGIERKNGEELEVKEKNLASADDENANQNSEKSTKSEESEESTESEESQESEKDIPYMDILIKKKQV